MYVCQIYRKKNSPSDAGLLRSCEIWFGSYLYVKGLSWESLFDFIEKKYVQFITCILLLKSMFFSQVLKDFRCWKSRNYSQIYISGIINYWGSILTLYITWGAFRVVFLFLFPVFFVFCQYFPWQTLTIHKIGWERE